MKELWKRFIDLILTEKDITIYILITAMIMSVVAVGVIQTRHKCTWTEKENNVWTTTRSDGSQTQFRKVIQECTECHTLRKYEL